MACPEELVARRIPSQNILSRLAARQMFGASYRRHSLNTVRGFHTNIFPDFTLVCERVTYSPFITIPFQVNVEKPPCFLRKFSPDGKRFIAFSADQTSLEIYAYQVAESIFYRWLSKLSGPCSCGGSSRRSWGRVSQQRRKRQEQ